MRSNLCREVTGGDLYRRCGQSPGRIHGQKGAVSVEKMGRGYNQRTYIIETMHSYTLPTVNVDIFAQYIFSRISRMVSDAQKYDVRENINYIG